jgi:hypothetical protein
VNLKAKKRTECGIGGSDENKLPQISLKSILFNTEINTPLFSFFFSNCELFID